MIKFQKINFQIENFNVFAFVSLLNLLVLNFFSDYNPFFAFFCRSNEKEIKGNKFFFCNLFLYIFYGPTKNENHPLRYEPCKQSVVFIIW